MKRQKQANSKKPIMYSWTYRLKTTLKSRATVQKALPENTYLLIVRKTRVHQRQLGCVFPSTFAGLLELSSHLSPALYSCASLRAHFKDGGISEQNSQLTDTVRDRTGLGQDDLSHGRQSHLQCQRNWRICLQYGFQGNQSSLLSWSLLSLEQKWKVTGLILVAAATNTLSNCMYHRLINIHLTAFRLKPFTCIWTLGLNTARMINRLGTCTRRHLS